MTNNNEIERTDMVVDREIDVDFDDPKQIIAYIETYFDVDKKFGLNINNEDGTWLNMYGIYNPFEDTLKINCIISREESESGFYYVPTKNEANLIKAMITEKIQEEYGQTPMEFCRKFMDTEQTMGGM